MKSKVILVPCSTYDEEEVYKAVSTGIIALGDIRNLIETDKRILVKPNLLYAADAEKGITTHPNVLSAILRILQENGYCHVSYGDSPGHGSNANALRKLGIEESKSYGAVEADMDSAVLFSFPEGKAAKEFHFARGVADADVVINVCKMKTHMLERITGAVKNVYGFVYGKQKAAGHVKYPNAGAFARMLADIHRCTDIRLHIMDGIIAMEGNGPASGTLTRMNVLLFSQDPVALDAVFCKLVCLNPELVPTCVQGEKMGIGKYRDKDIVVCVANGESVAEYSMDEIQNTYGNPNFDVDRKGTKKSWLSQYADVMTKIIKRPRIDSEKCIRCGVCVDHCPVPGKAVSFSNGRNNAPVYDYQKCIRCYCCQEMCPRHAISVGHL